MIHGLLLGGTTNLWSDIMIVFARDGDLEDDDFD